MGDLEWFQCGYLPRRGDCSPEDDASASTLTPCFPESKSRSDHARPNLTTVYPGGWGFAVGSSADGTVYTWGSCRDHFVNDALDDGRPLRMRGRAPAAAGFATVVASADDTNHPSSMSCAASLALAVRGWIPDVAGFDRSRTLDTGSPERRSEGHRRGGDTSRAIYPARPPPIPTGVRPKHRIRRVAAGEKHILAVSETGEAYHALAFEATDAETQNTHGFRRPLEFPEESARVPRIARCAAGARHSALVDEDGRVWTFGWGVYGQLGHESCEDESNPRIVRTLEGVGHGALDVSAGNAHTVALMADGSVYAFGSNRDGQLGVPAVSRRSDREGSREEEGTEKVEATGTPALVEFFLHGDGDGDGRSSPSPAFVSAVSCGSRHTACVTAAGELLTWGWNAYGQLGAGDTKSRDVPVEVIDPGSFENGSSWKPRGWSRVACGSWHTVAGRRGEASRTDRGVAVSRGHGERAVVEH
jgi:alpha-tubulin suppressor-like RCC1 family protein